MGLAINATMVFMSYQVQDSGIQFHFVCPDPGGEQPSDYYILVTDAEVAAITTLASAKTLILNKLARKYRALNIASKLDQFIGQSVVI